MIGFAHHIDFAEQVVKQILRFGVKSVGIEIASYALAIKPREDQVVLRFWQRVVTELTKKGIRVVSLTPKSFDKKLEQELSKLTLQSLDLKKLEEAIPEWLKGTPQARQWI